MDNRNETKRANRRALPKFILIMAISMLAGFAAGFFSVRCGLDALADGIRTASAFFGARVAPWLMLALAVVLPALSVPIYGKARRRLDAWDGEDEQIPDAVDVGLSVVIWISGAALILSLFLLAAAYSGGLAAFDDETRTAPFFLSVFSLLITLLEVVVIQQKCVDAVKRTNPEKTVSVYDLRFQRKWMESSDEAERLMIGRCAYKAYSATHMVCLILAVLLAMCALLFDIGFLPSLAVCVVWIVNHSVYSREAVKYAKAGSMVL